MNLPQEGAPTFLAASGSPLLDESSPGAPAKPVARPTTAAIDAAKSTLTKVLASAGVKHIVCIDDQYAKGPELEQVRAFLELLPPEKRVSVASLKGVPGLANVPPDTAGDVLAARVGEKWNDMSRSHQETLYKQLKAAAGATDSDAESPDAISANTLRLLAKVVSFEEQSLKEWRSKKSDLMKRAHTEPTLFLVDQDFTGEDAGDNEGVQIIKDMQDTFAGSGLLCGLLSHKYGPSQEHDKHEDFAKENSLERHRFMLISKRRINENPASFVLMIKLAILNPFCDLLKKSAKEALEASIQKAQGDLDAMSVYDFEKIVFESSRREGVWEPDTLFRVFGLFQRMHAREAAKDKSDLEETCERIRCVSAGSTEALGMEPRRPYLIQRLELYEEAAYLNRFHMPIELGDIFRTSTGKEYILIAQPCDLMVRGLTGSRKETVNDAVIVEIRLTLPKVGPGRSPVFELPYYKENGDPAFVDFRYSRSMRLWILDLCAFNPAGVARLDVSADCPKAAIPSWRKYFVRLKEIIGEYGNSPPTATLIPPLGANSDPVFRIDSYKAGAFVEYDCRRVRRLSSARATALLGEFAGYLSRGAFEHDFEGPSKHESTDEAAT